MTDINALLRECKSLLVKWPESADVAAQIDAFLAADMVAVPREPTEAMMTANAPPDERRGDEPTVRTYRRGIWKAMIAAAEKGE